MAGGSSDAAAILRGLNRYFENALSREELLALAEKVGSDVAFCLTGGTALAEGRGEVLTPLQPLPDCVFVICKPEFSISTPDLFRSLDQAKLRAHPDTSGILEAVANGDLHALCRRMYNVFEDVPDRRIKKVAGIKQKLLNAGAEGAVMTGTGSAVFGVFTENKAAEDACEVLKKEVPFVCTARPINRLL